MRQLYTLLFYAMLPAIFVRMAFRGFRNAGYWHRWGERLGFAPRLADDAKAPLIWVHAVSVGEVRAARPLVEALMQRWPGRRVLVTTMTPTGSEQVELLLGERVAHCYVPYDTPGAVKRFLQRTDPQIAIIMETELWPNLFKACAERGIPVFCANVRLSERSLRGYLKFRQLIKETVQWVTVFAAQSRQDARRVRQLGAPADRVHVTGSIKFEMDLAPSLQEMAQIQRHQWGNDRPAWVAASTREGEEKLILQAFSQLKEKHPDLLLVLAPRHPERFAAVARLCQKQGWEIARRSDGPGFLSPDVDIYIGDTMGELQLLYAASDVAFVGGSLVKTGGHNMLEPCAVGVPVVFGPHTFNFREISQFVEERGAGIRVQSVAELAEVLDQLLD
ncbi:MAG: 3-deoxy-D-manno-octulosonic acid transferase, partial [Gammaproteobacteria bacterium]